jgi:AraC family transcriptional regulator
MGSPRFATLATGSLQVTRAWFSPDDVLSAHTHGRATFGVMLRGSFDLGFPNGAIRVREFDCSAGTIFTEPAGELHRNRIGSAGAEVLVIQLDLASDDDSVQPFRPLLTDQINHFRHPAIHLNARRLAREISHPDALSELSAGALALDMLVLAARLRRARSTGAPPWLPRAEEYVRAHFRERLTIADVARAAGVHPAHLATVFREHHHVPLGEFIRRLRLEWVADRLENSSDSISSIAYAAGFADQSHLTRAFKGYTGQPPGALRRGLRQEPTSRPT